jgi:hypothetical protein
LSYDSRDPLIFIGGWTMAGKTSLILCTLAVVVFGVATSLVAHHGSGISYDLTKPWVTKATVTEFRYENPHPTMFFDRVNEKGEVEHWSSELITNPSFLIRAGWTRSRTLAALKPGTQLTLTLATSKAGGQSAVVTKLVNDKGEEILAAPENQNPLGRGLGGGGNGGRNNNPDAGQRGRGGRGQ